MGDPKAAVPKDAPHALRILKALVEHEERKGIQPRRRLEEDQYLKYCPTGQVRDGGFAYRGEKYFNKGNIEVWSGDDGWGRCWIVAQDVDESYAQQFISSRSLVPALVEGAKAVLDTVHPGWRNEYSVPLWNRNEMRVLIAFTKAVMPRMAKAGMKVPK